MTGFPGWKCLFFSAAVHLSGGRWKLPSALACPLHSSCSYRSSRGAKEADAAIWEGVAKFGKMQMPQWLSNLTGGSILVLPALRSENRYTPTAPFAHIVRFRVQLLLNRVFICPFFQILGHIVLWICYQSIIRLDFGIITALVCNIWTVM